jgi:hypothetical protein
MCKRRTLAKPALSSRVVFPKALHTINWASEKEKVLGRESSGKKKINLTGTYTGKFLVSFPSGKNYHCCTIFHHLPSTSLHELATKTTGDNDN